MSIQSGAETELAVSAGLPATHNIAGFAALTWTSVGELETLGDLVISHTPVTFKNLTTGKTSTLKGGEEPVTLPVVCALDRSDAGQVIMVAARKSKNNYSFRVTEPDGSITYFLGKVMKSGATYPGPDDVIRAPYDIGVMTPSGSGDTFVEDPA